MRRLLSLVTALILVLSGPAIAQASSATNPAKGRAILHPVADSGVAGRADLQRLPKRVLVELSVTGLAAGSRHAWALVYDWCAEVGQVVYLSAPSQELWANQDGTASIKTTIPTALPHRQDCAYTMVVYAGSVTAADGPGPPLAAGIVGILRPVLTKTILPIYRWPIDQWPEPPSAAVGSVSLTANRAGDRTIVQVTVRELQPYSVHSWRLSGSGCVEEEYLGPGTARPVTYSSQPATDLRANALGIASVHLMLPACVLPDQILLRLHIYQGRFTDTAGPGAIIAATIPDDLPGGGGASWW